MCPCKLAKTNKFKFFCILFQVTKINLFRPIYLFVLKYGLGFI